MSRVFAAVVTYRAPEKLASCLMSLDDTHRFVQDNSEENLLYTAGINEGIRHALIGYYKYVLVICDDVTVRPGAVAALSAYLDSNPECAIAMPVQVGKDGKVNCGGCTRAFPVGWHITEPLTHEMYREPFESYWANGACFLVRADAVRECGLMDENMRFICSDADWSFTMRARGWKIFVVPTALVEHEPDGALHYKNEFIEKTKDEDSLYFMKKWLYGGLFQELSQEGPTLTVQEISDRLMVLNGRLQYGYTKD